MQAREGSKRNPLIAMAVFLALVGIVATTGILILGQTGSLKTENAGTTDKMIPIRNDEATTAETTTPIPGGDSASGLPFFRAQRLLRDNVDEAISLMVSSFQEPELSFKLALLARRHCIDHPEDTVKFLDKMGSSSERFALLRGIANAIGKTRPTEVDKVFNLPIGGLAATNAWKRSLLEGLSENGNYKLASSLAEKMAFSNDRIDTMKAIAGAWVKNDIDGAIDWALKIGLAEEKTATLAVMLPEILKNKGPDFLVSTCVKSGDLALKKMAVGAIVRSMLENSQNSAIDNFIQGLQPDLRNSARFAEIQSDDSLGLQDGIARTTKIEDTGIRNSAKSVVLMRELRRDPIGATQYFHSLNQGEQLGIVSQFTSSWYDLDSIALSDWINGIAAGKVKDEALVILALRLSGSDKSAASQVARAISDDQRRRSTIEAVGRQ